MFNGCRGLTSLDVSNFNTSNVINMSYMFAGCSNSTTIYAGCDWSTTNVTNSDNMFNTCTSLVGSMGTVYDAEHVDATYAHIDGGPSDPGYFTAGPPYTHGDTDDDGKVSIADVTAIIDYILSGNSAGINLTAADVDDSGTVNIADVTALIDYLLAGSW